MIIYILPHKTARLYYKNISNKNQLIFYEQIKTSKQAY